MRPLMFAFLLLPYVCVWAVDQGAASCSDAPPGTFSVHDHQNNHEDPSISLLQKQLEIDHVQHIASVELPRKRIQTEVQVLCEVQQTADAKGGFVKVLMKGDQRYMSFGSNIAEEPHSMVHCPYTACTQSSSVVDDVAKCLPCPCDHKGTRVDKSDANSQLLNAVKPFCSHGENSRTFDILVVGLGGGVLHRHLRQSCSKRTRIRTIELDPRIVKIAENFFGLDLETGTSEVQVGDALEVLVNMSQKSQDVSSPRHLTDGLGELGWDLVVVDCFNDDDQIPQNCKSVEFLKAVRDVLKPGGQVIQHVYHDWLEGSQKDSLWQRKEFRKIRSNYDEVFGVSKVRDDPFPHNVSFDEGLVVARNQVDNEFA